MRRVSDFGRIESVLGNYRTVLHRWKDRVSNKSLLETRPLLRVDRYPAGGTAGVHDRQHLRSLSRRPGFAIRHILELAFTEKRRLACRLESGLLESRPALERDETRCIVSYLFVSFCLCRYPCLQAATRWPRGAGPRRYKGPRVPMCIWTRSTVR